MAQRISVRIDSPEIESMLAQINRKPATATQMVLELFTAMHRSTILEIRGLFTRDAFYARTKKPVLQIMCNTSIYALDIVEAEKYKSSISNHNAAPLLIIDKIKKMTSVQTAILQLEIFSFWEQERKYHEHVDLLSRNVPRQEIISSRNRQKNPDFEPLFKLLS